MKQFFYIALYQRRYTAQDVLGADLHQRFSGKEFWRV